jgi:di/tricarboxylate transporter
VAPESLGDVTHRAGLEIVPAAGLSQADICSEAEHIELVEAVVMPDSATVGRTLRGLNLRRRFDLTVMAISRHGQRLTRRLADHRLVAGDTLLIQGDRQKIDTNLPEIGCLPLATREIRLQRGGPLARILVIFLGAVLAASVGLLHVAVAFALGAFLMVATRCIRLEELYKAIEWPIIILIGGMIPLGTAMVKTGTATWVATSLVDLVASTNPHLLLGVLFALVASLTMVLNNPTVAVVMAPIAIDIAARVDASPRPFLMLTAIAASCAFLSPVSHKANILVWGPGGYRFLDYTKVGLPLIFLIGVVCVIMVPILFPF